MDCKNAKGLRRTVSGILGSGPCSSGHGRGVVFREGSYPVGHSLAAHQPTYAVCCWGLREDFHSVGHLVSVLGVKQNLGDENQRSVSMPIDAKHTFASWGAPSAALLLFFMAM